MTADDCLTVAKAELSKARQLIHDEICAYPTPVSGCDVQFNYLIGLRGSVSDALRILEAPRFIATPRALSPGARIESR